jgi:tRNA pseudouridine65 synthase
MLIDSQSGPINILFQSAEIIAISKPEGLAIHRSKLVRNADEFLVDILAEAFGKQIYPIHRLDRKTSGVMLLALNKTALRKYNKAFAERKVVKTYHAIVRGHLLQDTIIDYDLPNHAGNKSTAITEIKILDKSEIALSDGRFPTSRYTLVEAKPLTGRTHQIRKHLAHIFHPIIGDRPHGCNKQNRLVLESFGLHRMMLHASRIIIEECALDIISPMPHSFLDGMHFLGISDHALGFS